MSEQTPLSEALASAAEHASVMAERLHKAVRLMTEQAATLIAAATADQLFEHTDDDGDSLVVKPLTDTDLSVRTPDASEVYLDQDAVNRLAQYLDRHRTDKPGWLRIHDVKVDVMPEPEEQCPWAFLHPETQLKPYESYDRCQSAVGHDYGVQGDTSHGDDYVRFRASDPQAFRVGFQDGSPNPQPDPATDNPILVELCLGSDQPATRTGCAHSRLAHGALGCAVVGCPCVRRSGK